MQVCVVYFQNIQIIRHILNVFIFIYAQITTDTFIQIQVIKKCSKTLESRWKT